ncbi:MAG: cytochrome P450 [Chloroflexota bacterium]
MTQISASSVLTAAPAPSGLPLLGILPRFAGNPLQFLLDAAIRYGPVVRLDLASRQTYLVSHPEGIKHILQDNNRNYNKGYHQAKPLMGEGLVTSEGEFWRSQRRLIQPSFNRQQLAEYADVMVTATRESFPRWDDFARSQQPVNVAEEMMRLTQMIIVRTMFSDDIGDQAVALGKAFDQTLEHLNRALFSPHPIIEKLPTPANLRHQRALRFLDEFIYTLIQKRRANPDAHNDLLSRLILARDPDSGEGMPDRQIRDELMTIFLAGHETTANALAWTYYLLGSHPQVEAGLVSEIETLGGRQPLLEDLPALPYSALVFSEALRLYPPAWMFARHAIEEDAIQGVRIPAGAMIFLSPYVTQRLPAFWDDPQRFDPQRFSEERSAARQRYAYFPFGGGPRQCIGNHFAQMEAQLIMTMMLQRYHLQPVEGIAVKPTPIATLQPRPGVFVRFHIR